MQILLANPRGFCAGVDRAIEIVERALELFGAPVYVRHEVVHNKYVVNSLRHKGAIFLEELDEVPDDSTVIFSAHGVSKAVRDVAARRGLRVFDAICPLVTKVHMEVGKYQDEERECILIGHEGHPEVEGTVGQYQPKSGKGGMYIVESVEDVMKLKVKNPNFLAFVTQTTLSMDDTSEVINALRKRFPKISGPKKKDICYATQNRQDAVKKIATKCDIFIVIGAKNSSNSLRLVEVARQYGAKKSILLENIEKFDHSLLKNANNVGLTASASAPEILVQNFIQILKNNYAIIVNELNYNYEDVSFKIPQQLKNKI